MGQSDDRVRGGVGVLLRRPARRVHDATDAGARGPASRRSGIGPGRRGRHGRASRSTRPSARSCRPARDQSSSTSCGRLLHGPGAGRGGDHAAHQGDHAGPPVSASWPTWRPSSDRRAARAARSSRTRPGPRRRPTRPPGRRSSARDVQPLRDEEPDDRRGRLRTTDDDKLADRLRAVPEPRHARPLSPRDALGSTSSRRTSGPQSGSLSSPTWTNRPPPAAERRRQDDGPSPTACAAQSSPRAGRTSAHQYTMRFPGERRRVMRRCGSEGSARTCHYPMPVHRQPHIGVRPWGRGPRPAGHRPAVPRRCSSCRSIRASPRTELEAVIAAVAGRARPRGA